MLSNRNKLFTNFQLPKHTCSNISPGRKSDQCQKSSSLALPHIHTYIHTHTHTHTHTENSTWLLCGSSICGHQHPWQFSSGEAACHAVQGVRVGVAHPPPPQGALAGGLLPSAASPVTRYGPVSYTHLTLPTS